LHGVLNSTVGLDPVISRIHSLYDNFSEQLGRSLYKPQSWAQRFSLVDTLLGEWPLMRRSRSCIGEAGSGGPLIKRARLWYRP
jgi:hypothetical protein